MEIVKQFEDRWLDAFKSLAERITATYSFATAEVDSSTIGPIIRRVSHLTSISCDVWSGPNLETQHGVDLCVSLDRLDLEPVINVSIEWGYAEGVTEYELFPESVPCTCDNLNKVSASMPEVFDRYIVAIERRFPLRE